MSSVSLLHSWLRQNIASYSYPDRLFADVDATLRRFPTFRPKTDVYTYDDGRTQLLLCLHGLLPITFRNASYHIPVAIWVTKEYPRQPPMAYVTPTSDMLVRPGRFVQVSGLCTIEYIAGWERKSEGCSLSGLVEALQAQFSLEPPVYSKPKQQQPPRTNPSTPADYASRPPPPTPPTSRPSPSSAPVPVPVTQDARPALPPKPPSASATPVPLTMSPGPQSSPSTNGGPSSPVRYQSPAPPPKPPLPPQPYWPGPSQQLHSTPAAQPHQRSTSIAGFSSQAQTVPQYQSTSLASPPPAPNAHHRWSLPPPQSSTAPVPLPLGTSTPPVPVNPHPNAGSPPPPPAFQPRNHPVQPPQPPHVPQPQYSAIPPLRPQPIPDLLDEEISEEPPAPPVPAAPAPAPPRPPNPELLSLHARVHGALTSELASLSHAMTLDAERLRAQQADLLAGMPAVRDEMARLEAVRDVCRGVVGKLGGTVAQAEKNVAELKRKGDPPVDELVCSTSIVHNQLIDLVAEDNAIEDTIYHLHRALNTGRIDLDRFLRTARVLAEEQFMKRALIEKIQVGMPLGASMGMGSGMGLMSTHVNDAGFGIGAGGGGAVQWR